MITHITGNHARSLQSQTMPEIARSPSNHTMFIITGDVGNANSHPRCRQSQAMLETTCDGGNDALWQSRTMQTITNDAGNHPWRRQWRTILVATHDVGNNAWCWQSCRMPVINTGSNNTVLTITQDDSNNGGYRQSSVMPATTGDASNYARCQQPHTMPTMLALCSVV